jgi:hypothetical protein
VAETRWTWLGLFAHVLHIRPWEVAELTVAEFRTLVAWLEEYNRNDHQGE